MRLLRPDNVDLFIILVISYLGLTLLISFTLWMHLINFEIFIFGCPKCDWTNAHFVVWFFYALVWTCARCLNYISYYLPYVCMTLPTCCISKYFWLVPWCCVCTLLAYLPSTVVLKIWTAFESHLCFPCVLVFACAFDCVNVYCWPWCAWLWACLWVLLCAYMFENPLCVYVHDLAVLLHLWVVHISLCASLSCLSALLHVLVCRFLLVLSNYAPYRFGLFTETVLDVGFIFCMPGHFELAFMHFRLLLYFKTELVFTSFFVLAFKPDLCNFWFVHFLVCAFQFDVLFWA